MTRPVPIGRKVVVYGPSGSGKSTLAEALASRLGLPWIELDPIYHARPNWDDLSADDFRQALNGLLPTLVDGWVMDGNYHVAIDVTLPLTDSIIWLDLPFTTVYRQLAKRTLSRTLSGAELWNGNRETFRQTFLSRESMLWWGIHAWRWSQTRVRRAIETRQPGTRVYRLRTPGQVRYLLENATLDVPQPAPTPLPSDAPEKEANDANVP